MPASWFSTKRESTLCRRCGVSVSIEPSYRSCRLECGDPGLCAAEDEGMDVMRALIGVDRLEIHHVPDHRIFVDDAVAAMHVARGSSDVERFAGRVALEDRDHLRRCLALILQSAEA